MNLAKLIDLFSKATSADFLISGPFGFIHVIPEQKDNTFHVDCKFSAGGKMSPVLHRDGFRRSTVCCLSACVLFGEHAVDSQMIEEINRRLNPTENSI